MEFTSHNKVNSKIYQGLSLIFDHFKEREKKLVHELYKYKSVNEVANLLGVSKKFLYTNYGSINGESSEVKDQINK
jgi:transposase